MIGGRMNAMMEDVIRNTTIIKEVHRTTGRILFKDGSEMVLRSITQDRDAEMIRGQRFDMVLEHGSFRGPYDLLQLIRLTVLRP